MATLAWVVFKHHRKADGTFNPKIKVYHKGTTVYLPTQVYTSFVRFRKGESTGTITDGDIVDALNFRIKEMRQVLNRHEEIVEACEDAKSVAAFIDRKLNQDRNLDFIAFAKKVTEGLKENGSKSIKNSLINHLRDFTGADILPVKKLTSAFLVKFEAWMKSERVVYKDGKERRAKPMRNSSVQTYMEVLRGLYNKMLRQYNDYETGDIVIVGDPFKAYNVHQDVSYVKKAVPAETIRRIAAYVPEGKGVCTQLLARDMFVLSFCLAGMNLVDLYTCEDYSDGHISYQRTKTRGKKLDKAFISVPVNPEIRALFEKYRDEEGRRVFNLYRLKSFSSLRTSVAQGLSRLCRDLRIEPVTFYAARHSFATIARNDCDVSMEDVAMCLTHASGFRMTDTYVKPDFSRVDRAIRKVLDFVFHPEEESAAESLSARYFHIGRHKSA